MTIDRETGYDDDRDRLELADDEQRERLWIDFVTAIRAFRELEGWRGVFAALARATDDRSSRD